MSRIKNLINDLESKGETWIPYGGSNPYAYCKDCNRSIVEGHSEDCPFFEREKTIADLKELIEALNFYADKDIFTEEGKFAGIKARDCLRKLGLY